MTPTQRKKWWEVATTQDELDLFHLLARNPKYEWRGVDNVLKKLQWTPSKFQQVAGPFLKMKIIVEKNSKKGFLIGYWERVNDQNEDLLDEQKEVACTASLFDPNLI